MVRIAVIGGEVRHLDVLSALRFNRLDKPSGYWRQTIVRSNHQQWDLREALRRIADAERLRIGGDLIPHALGVTPARGSMSSAIIATSCSGVSLGLPMSAAEIRMAPAEWSPSMPSLPSPNRPYYGLRGRS